MEQIRDYLKVVLRGWWIILAVTLIGTGAAYIYSHSQPNVYAASTTFIANPDVTTSQLGQVIWTQDIIAARSEIVNTYCNILESGRVQREAIARLGMPDLLLSGYDVNCIVRPDSTFMELRVEGPSPYLAADYANAIVASGVQEVDTLQEVFDLTLMDEAAPNETPIAPNHTQTIILGAAVSFVGAIVVLVGRKLIDDLLNDESTLLSPQQSS